MTAERAVLDESDMALANVGLRSTMLHGWFRADLGQVYPGLPVGPDDVVADIGCGDGGAANFCVSLGARAILSDIDAPRLDAAYRRIAEQAPGRVEAHPANGEALPLPDAIATRTICTEVIEHVDHPVRLMSELYRITRPGGLLLISCPDPRSEEVQKAVAPASYFAAPNHLRILSAAELTGLVTEAGFVVERFDTYGFYWAIYLALFWSAGIEMGERDPMLDAWAHTWQHVLASKEGLQVQRALDSAMPKSQIIVARRPA